MKPTRVKPISYVKANAADLIRELKEMGSRLSSQNGEATAVMQDVATYEATRETLALLKILALGRRQVRRAEPLRPRMCSAGCARGASELMRLFEVRMTAHAVRDLEELVDWIARHDGPARAQHVLARIQKAVDALKRFLSAGRTRRSSRPWVSANTARPFSSYRIVYHVEDVRVFISLIADGRRDMRSLLARRLLAG